MQRLTTWEVRACTPTKVAAERGGVGCGGLVNLERVETDGLLEEQPSKIARGTRTEYCVELISRLNRGESSVLNV